MAMKNITDLQVLKAYVNQKLLPKFSMWDLLMLQTGESLKVCRFCMERVIARGYVEVEATAPSAWLTDKGIALLAAEGYTDLTEPFQLEFASFKHFRNTLWEHHNGVPYTLLHVANIYADADRVAEFPITVVYEDQQGVIWTRPMDEFLIRFHPTGALVNTAKGETGHFLPATANEYRHAKERPSVYVNQR